MKRPIYVQTKFVNRPILCTEQIYEETKLMNWTKLMNRHNLWTEPNYEETNLRTDQINKQTKFRTRLILWTDQI